MCPEFQILIKISLMPADCKKNRPNLARFILTWGVMVICQFQQWASLTVTMGMGMKDLILCSLLVNDNLQCVWHTIFLYYGGHYVI